VFRPRILRPTGPRPHRQQERPAHLTVEERPRPGSAHPRGRRGRHPAIGRRSSFAICSTSARWARTPTRAAPVSTFFMSDHSEIRGLLRQHAHISRPRGSNARVSEDLADPRYGRKADPRGGEPDETTARACRAPGTTRAPPTVCDLVHHQRVPRGDEAVFEPAGRIPWSITDVPRRVSGVASARVHDPT